MLESRRPQNHQSFFAWLEARILTINSFLVVGIDPHPEDLSSPTPEVAREFALRIIEASAPYAAAFKPNVAFFEALGPEGIAVLAQVIKAIPADIPVILDAKRGDIGSTSEAYARAVYDGLGADAVTLHGWMGPDSIAPFVADPSRAAFVLCRTSNPGAKALQECLVVQPSGPPIPMYVHLAAQSSQWSAFDNVGLVVGATSPQAIALVRAAAPTAWILAPGVGAQGGDLERTLQAGLRHDGLGMLMSVSRGISRANDPREAAAQWAARCRIPTSPVVSAPDVDLLADGLLETGCVQFGEFKLKSGLISPVYIDLRRLIASPVLLAAVASAYAVVMQSLQYDLIAPLPYAAMPIGTAVSLQTGEPMVYPRKEVKSYGTAAQVEGVFESGQCAVMLDDLATTGGSKIEALERLCSVGLCVRDCVVLIDRQSGAAERMAEAGLTMHAVYTLSDLVDRWERAGRITGLAAADVRSFLAKTAANACTT